MSDDGGVTSERENAPGDERHARTCKNHVSWLDWLVDREEWAPVNADTSSIRQASEGGGGKRRCVSRMISAAKGMGKRDLGGRAGKRSISVWPQARRCGE